MRFTTLRDKKYPDGWGAFHANEIYHSGRPVLMGENVTMEMLKDFHKDNPTILSQLDNFELITVELVIL